MQDIVATLSLCLIYVLFALGMSLTWGMIDVLNFAHGGTFVLTAYVAQIAAREWQLSIVPLMLIGIVVGALASMLCHLVAFDPISRRSKDRASGERQGLVAGIGLGAIAVAFVGKQTDEYPFGFSGSSYRVVTWEFLGTRVTSIQATTVGVAAVLVVLLAWWIRSSKQGLALRSIGIDPETASLMGANRRNLAYGLMALAGALAGLAGVLLTFGLTGITAETGNSLLVKAFACIILGGVGSMWGVLVGSFVLAFAETMVLTHTSGTWVNAIAFGIIFLVLIVRPVGLFGQQSVVRT